jgi:hypothetical protein
MVKSSSGSHDELAAIYQRVVDRRFQLATLRIQRGKTRTLEVMKGSRSFRRLPRCRGSAGDSTVEMPQDVWDGSVRLTAYRVHVRVLATMHIPYKVEKRNGEVAVWWTPRSDAEEREVDSRVSQYAAAIRECARDEWPTPSTPARAVFSCKGVKP